MFDRDRFSSDQLAAAASEKIKEREYWLKKLSGGIVKSIFPYDYRNGEKRSDTHQRLMKSIPFEVSHELVPKLIKLSKESHQSLYVILAAGLVLLLEKYSGQKDIIIGSPIFKQGNQRSLINTVLVLRTLIEENMTFKELLLKVKQTIVEAIENRNYPLEILIGQLGFSGLSGPGARDDFPLFDAAILLENIHDKSDIHHIDTNIKFSFLKNNRGITAQLEFNRSLYREDTITRITHHFNTVLEQALLNLNAKVSDIDALTDEEKKQLLVEFNKTRRDYPKDKTIHELFEEQVGRTPDGAAVIGVERRAESVEQDVRARGVVPFPRDYVSVVTYKELNRKSNRLARVLRDKGVKPDTAAGIILDRSIELITGILAILKAGGAYLPINVDSPGKRVKYMLEDSNAPVVLTKTSMIKDYSFIDLKGLKESKTKLRICRTGVREQIKDLERLPIPDRSLVSYEKYGKDIGMAMAKHTIALQATRGCPYKCIYCHKIWPKKHVFRSAQHIFNEVKLYYHMGVKRFAIIDDIFNLNIKNSRRFFELIIENGLDVQIFFPNGVRGDILTRDYIDLMIEAGTINIALALETASPRLQKLIGKNLNIDKLHENMAYICESYPHVISELFTMHGFPTETEEEANKTMDFIKNLRWLHLPHVNILKIYPNTDMADFAIKHGISAEAIARSENLAYHELPETLPFDGNFTMKYQADYLDYFLSKERLLHVLPYQMKVLTRGEMLQKYNSFLPTEINELDDLLKLAGISREELGPVQSLGEDDMKAPGLDRKMKHHFASMAPEKEKNAIRILLMDVSRFFSKECDMLYDVSEAPLGLMYLMTYLNKTYGGKINGKIAKSRTDFDSFEELRVLLKEFNPDLIGIRALTYFNQFFHKTVSMIRLWGFDIPVIAGGPYATSDYKRILQDKNVDLVVLGEGEVTFGELVGNILKNNKKMPSEKVLQGIPGIAFVPEKEKQSGECGREIILVDEIQEVLSNKSGENLALGGQSRDLAYTMFTSGSTGQPKAVLVEHRNVVRLVKNTNFITLNEGDHLLQTAPLEFDASTIEIWGTLLNGLSFYLTTEDNILDPEDIKAFIRKYDIITMWMTSPLFNQMLEADMGIFSGLKHIIIGGDALSPTHINQLKCKYPHLNVINGYGPTENTTFSTTYLIDREYNGSIPIGKPIANSTAYILDRYNHLVPIGVSGELYVGGDGVSRGYLNNPELTRQKYIANPSVEGDVLYRTGDNTRWLPDRSIEFLGRMDHQVKIRGIRIELGEIENQILHLPGIQETVVLAKQDKNKEKYLCAYVVLREKQGSKSKAIDLSGLKQKLAVNLPDYMLPSHFMQLPEIPLTQNGKVDREALPDPEIVAGKDHLPPRNELEKKLAAIWADVLDVDKEAIGIHSNFFDLGGHSLKATVLISAIFKELNVKIPLAELFISQTIMELAQYIESSKQDKFFSIEPVEEKEYYELSSAQKRLYILQQLDLASTAYNIPETFYLAKDLDIPRLEETFAKLVQRHESLRTSIEIVDKQTVQEIHQNVEFHIEYYEAKNSTPGVKDEGLYADIIGEFIRPFDLVKAPLFRVGLITAEERNVLLVDMHHIISDGTSHDVLIKEFRGVYEGKELPGLRLQYKDYAEWQHSKGQREIIKEQEDYWIREFSGERPVLNLPTDYPRPAAQSFAGAAVDFTLNRAETQIIKKIAKETDATLYMVMLSIFNILLSKLGGQEDIIVGTPIAARRHADLQRIIGMFVNTLTLRHFPTGDKTFNEFLEEVKIRTLQAFENQEYPFEDLVDKVMIQRDPSRNPVFDVMFNLLNQAEYSKEGLYNRQNEKEKEDFLHKKCMSKFDLTLTAVDLDEYLDCTIIYSTKLFKPETIETFIKYFRTIVSTLYPTIDQRIADIEIISKDEKNRLVYEFNRPQTEFPGDKTIHRLFEEQVERTPQKAALVGGRQHAVSSEDKKNTGETVQLTYRELNARSNQLARGLRTKGVKPDTIAAIMAAPSVEMIIGILAILKAGGAFLPIDPDYPVERRKYLFDDAGVNILLSQKEYIDPSANGYHVIDLDSEDIYTGNRDNLEWENSAKGLVYVIYTSGSTGKPKGVLLKHENLVNYVDWFSKEADLSSADKTMLTSSFAFDLGYTSISTSILNGGQLHLLEKEIYLSPENVINYIRDNRITYVKMTPSLFTIIVNSDLFRKQMVETLRLIVLGGEEIKPDDVEEARGICDHIRIMNHYGPTEATIGCIAQFIDFDHFDEYKNKPTIGKPINNTNVFILDRYLKLQPIGVPGELLISGVSVARGYLNRPELTAEKFDQDLFDFHDYHDDKRKENYQKFFGGSRGAILQKSPPGLLYKTGDLARWLADGNIEFLGRIDHQVKIRGYRIELGEIENRLLNLENIKEAVVLVKEDKSRDKYLCAYVIPKTPGNNGAVDFSEIKKELLENLPDYMIPSCFVELEKMPLTPNGKVNRKALPEPEMSAAHDFIAPFTPLEKKLAEIWADVLGLNKGAIGVQVNFFELGGHSLKATILASKIDKQLNVKVPLVEIFKTPTITGLSKYIRETGENEREKRIDDEKLVLLSQGIDTKSHMFFIHDATGEVEGYIELCNHFKSDFNCWGMRTDRLKNLTPRNITINRIAGEYIKSIKKVQATGPYHIVGWSLGGIIAYEIVRQLEEQHQLTGFFAMIDTYAMAKDVAAKAPGFSVHTEVDFMQNVWGDEGIIKQLKNETELEGIWVKVVDYLESNKNQQKIIDDIIIKYNIHRVLPNIGQLSLRDKIHYINVMRSLHNARMQYLPTGKIKTLIHFFKADNTSQNVAVEQIPWNDYSTESIKTYKLSGDHYSILTGPDVINLAKLLENAINLN